MPLVDRFLGAIGGPDKNGDSTRHNIWFDGDDTSEGTVLGLANATWDAGSVVNVDEIRLRWSFGGQYPGFGAAGAFAIDRGDSAVGPWTEVLADAAPHMTAGVTYPHDFEVVYDLGSTETARYWRFRSTTSNNNDVFTVNGYENLPEDPDEPPVDPGYVPPLPGHAILEIYVHDESASRWGTATWGDDPPTGTTGVWSGEGWQDVTPEGLTVHATFGTTDATRGILARQEAQSWLVTTYDPDRILDPSNTASGFYPELISGVPIRLSNATSGRVVRTAVIDRIAYQYKAPDYRGTIQASSTIAILWRAEIPAGTVLGDTLRERIIDAVVSSGVAIGGIPITGFDDSYPDIPLATLDENPRSVWEAIYQACEEVGWIAYEDEHGTIQVRPYGNPVDRGAEITYANLEDLQAESSEDGQASVVRVLNADGSAVVERVAAPLPRYGRRAATDRENIRTIDPEGYADAVLADRAWPGVAITPGTVWAFTQAEAEFYCALELVERVRLLVPGKLDTAGVLLGMEIWVESRDAERSRWLFKPYMTSAGSSSPGGVDTLVADDDGSFLVADDDASVYLEADG